MKSSFGSKIKLCSWLGDSTQTGQPEKLRQIRVADDFKIPARCEIIIDVFIDRFDEDPPSQLHNFILEPNDDFIRNAYLSKFIRLACLGRVNGCSTQQPNSLA
jgi:hypothetical protein